MTDVTDLIQRYRLALRYIWNSCFWVDPNLRDWESVYSFRNLKLPLFRALIADSLELKGTDRIFGAGFKVVPGMKGVAGLPSLQVDSRVPSDPEEYGGTWLVVKGPINADEVSLTLIDLFDWTPLGYIDLRYYVVRIEAFLNHPEKVGQHALVDVTQASVFWEPVSDSQHEEEKV